MSSLKLSPATAMIYFYLGIKQCKLKRVTMVILEHSFLGAERITALHASMNLYHLGNMDSCLMNHCSQQDQSNITM